VVLDGTIVEAVDNQPWSGEANVHVSIVNWVKSQDRALLPPKRRLWFKLPQQGPKRPRRPRGIRPAMKQYELDVREVPHLSSSLSDKVDVSQAATLTCNKKPKRYFEGIQPGHDGFRLKSSEAIALIPATEFGAVVFPYLGGTEFITSAYSGPSEYIIDFDDMDLLSARRHEIPLKLVQERVLPDWEKNAKAELQATGKARGEHQTRVRTWWKLKRGKAELVKRLAASPRFIVCSRVTKRPIFAFVDSRFRPDSSLSVFLFDDDYSFGVLQSSAHSDWFIAKCSNLKSDPRYTSLSVFETFPWPQHPSDLAVRAVAHAAVELRKVRAVAMAGRLGGLRDLYRSLDLPGENPLKEAQARLDAVVRVAYGFETDRDLLHALLELNVQLALEIAQGKQVAAPGIPITFQNPGDLVSPDCLGSGPASLI
jgi:hypothetical protein